MREWGGGRGEGGEENMKYRKLTFVKLVKHGSAEFNSLLLCLPLVDMVSRSLQFIENMRKCHIHLLQ